MSKCDFCAALAATAVAVAVVSAAEKAPPRDGLEKQFAAFLKKPTKKTFTEVRKSVVSSPKYDPYGTDPDDLRELADQGRLEAAQQKMAETMPNFLLSPRAHRYVATAARKAGDLATAKKELAIAQKCIEGILATGDGSREKPYLVTRVQDEYDLLPHLKRKKDSQGLVLEDGRSYDVIQCQDGSEVWFDITEVFESLKRPFKKQGDKEE